MTTQQQKESPKEQLSTYLYFSSLYFVTVGVLYLWGYWSAFNINILEYLTLADVIKSTAYPIASGFVFAMIGAIIAELMVSHDTFPHAGGSNTKVGRFLRKLAPAIILIYVSGTVALFIFGPTRKWLLLPVLLAMPIYFFAKERRFLEAVIAHESPRSIVIFLLATLPAFAYGHGRIKAQDIIDGRKFEYVLSPVDQVAVPDHAEPAQRLRFLGHAGDFLFFLEPIESKVAISKIEGGTALLLKRYSRPASAGAKGPNPSIEGTAPGTPGPAAYVKPYTS